MISLKKVSKYYNLLDNKHKRALDDISISFEINEMTAIIGNSGSGKTTLLKSIIGIIDCDGSVIIDGVERGSLEDKEWNNYINKMCSYVSQEYNLISTYTCYDNIDLAFRTIMVNKKERHRKILEISKELRIEDVLFQKISKISGGQKQRCAIAQAISKDTPIMIFDELTSNLDEDVSDLIYRLLSRLSRRKTIIIVTHDQENIRKYCSKILKIENGKVISVDNLILRTSNTKYHEDEYKNIKSEHFVDLILLSKKNLCLSLKERLFPFILISLSLFFVIISFSMLTITMKNNNSYNVLFPNSQEGRLVVSKLDSDSFTESEIDTLINIECDNSDESKCINSYMYNDFLLDYEFTLYKSFTKVKCSYYPLSAIEDNDIVEGRMPENDNEVIIYNTSSFNVGDELVLSEEYSSLYISVTVVGKTNSSDNLIYLSDSKVDEILKSTEHQNIYSNYVSFSGLTSNNEFINAQDIGVLVSSTIQREKVLLNYDYFIDYYLIDEMNNEEAQQYINDIIENLESIDEVEVVLTDSYGNNVSYIFSDIEIVSSTYLFAINEDLFYELFYRSRGYQISVFTNNDEDALFLEKEIESLDDNYDVLVPSSASVEIDHLNEIQGGFITLLVFLCSIVTFSIIVFIIMYVQKRKRRDEFHSFFFVGISRRNINIMVMIENLVIFLGSVLFVVIIVIILEQIPQIRIISSNILLIDSDIIITMLFIILFFYIIIDYHTSKIHNSYRHIK